MTKVLYINDDPQPELVYEAFEHSGVKLDLTIAATVEMAESYLKEAENFDAILTDYELDGGKNAVSSDLIKTALNKGFGIGKKPLIAYSQGHNDQLVTAGCSHSCAWYDINELVHDVFCL